MKEGILFLTDFSKVLFGEYMALSVLLAIILTMFIFSKKGKSSLFLFLTIIIKIVQIFCDAQKYYFLLGHKMPITLVNICLFISYSFCYLYLLSFSLFVFSYIKERTNIKKYYLYPSLALGAFSFISVSILALLNKLYVFNYENLIILNNFKDYILVLHSLFAIYISFLSFVKIKNIGIKPSLIFSFVGVIPSFVMLFFNQDYSLIVSAFSILVIYIFRCQEKDKEDKYREEENLGLLKQINILSSFGNVFSSIYLANIKDKTMQQVIAENNNLYNFGKREDAQIVIDYILNSFIKESHIPLIKEFVNFDTIDERLQNDKVISSDYLDVNNVWRRCLILPVEKDENGSNTIVLIASRNISKEVSSLEVRDNMIKTLSKPYVDSFSVDGESGMCVNYHMDPSLESRYGNILIRGNYNDNLKLYLDNEVLDVDKHLFDEILTLDKTKEVLKKQNTYSFTYRIKREGEIHFIQCSLIKEESSEGGFVIAFKNVDEEAYRQLKQDEKIEQQREIIEALGNEYFSILIVDMENDFVTIFRTNNNFGKMITRSCEENNYSWTKSYSSYISKGIVLEENWEEYTNKLSIENLKKTNDDFSFVYGAKIKDNDPEFFEARITYVKNKDDKDFAVVGTRNVDNVIKKEREQEKILQKAKKEAEMANEAKTNFLFNMSHDIRTPMNALLGYSLLMKKKIKDPELLNYQEKIEKSGEILLSLINNVLDMARIESGKMELDEEYTNINSTLNDLYNLFLEEANKKDLVFTKEIHIKNENVLCDETKFKEIIINLLSNACKYTLPGGTIKCITQEKESSKEGYITLLTTISDTGIGMSKEFLPTIFESFSRERNKSTGNVVGTGLGMPIVKRLVDMMGGTIEVESELGKGTTFYLTLSFKIADERYYKKNKESIHNVLNKDVIVGKHILLAEDNELNAEIAIALLEEMGLVVERVADGIECVNKYEKSPYGTFDLILMDVQMPNMDGYKATKYIRRIPDKEKANIPIVAMTANAFEEDKQNAFNAGMNAHIAKPLQVDKIIYTLGYIFDNKNSSLSIDSLQIENMDNLEGLKAFKEEYEKKNIPLGKLIYEAFGEEKILYANDVLIEMLGCSSIEEFNEYVKSSFKNIVYHEDLEKTQNAILTQIDDSDKFIDRIRYRIKKKDGTLIEVDDIGRKSFWESGKPIFYVFLAKIK